MIHPEGAIQTPKGSGLCIDGKIPPLGRCLTKQPSWWEKCCQQVIGHKDGLRLPERLRAIACVNPRLNSSEEWGESVSSFLPTGNNLVFALVTHERGRNRVVSRQERRGFSYPTLRDRSGYFFTRA